MVQFRYKRQRHPSPPVVAIRSTEQPARIKYSIPIKNLEIWDKRAHNLVAINSHADLFSMAAYLCL